MNREEWLTRSLPLLAREVFAPAGLTVPEDVKVACSWPGGGSARTRIGECWPRAMSQAGVNEVFISPTIENPVTALDILVHELIHAIDDCASGHKAPFKRMATAVGLTGKPTATVAGPELQIKLVTIANKLGTYPHRRLDLSGRKKQTTRNLKVSCTACGCVFRLTAKWVEQAGEELACPVCHAEAVADV